VIYTVTLNLKTDLDFPWCIKHSSEEISKRNRTTVHSKKHAVTLPSNAHPTKTSVSITGWTKKVFLLEHWGPGNV
jgi:hypothetical protein